MLSSPRSAAATRPTSTATATPPPTPTSRPSWPASPASAPPSPAATTPTSTTTATPPPTPTSRPSAESWPPVRADPGTARGPIQSPPRTSGDRMLITEPYLEQAARWPSQGRHILAHFDDRSIVVYQAYKPQIAQFA